MKIELVDHHDLIASTAKSTTALNFDGVVIDGDAVQLSLAAKFHENAPCESLSDQITDAMNARIKRVPGPLRRPEACLASNPWPIAIDHRLQPEPAGLRLHPCHRQAR